MLYGNRPHIILLLRLGPIQLLLLANMVAENQGSWNPSFLPLLNQYLLPLEMLAWHEESDWERGRGISYSRWSLSHKTPYSGFDEGLRYKRYRWASFIERDGAHEPG